MGEKTATTATTAGMARLLGFSRQNLEKIAAAGWVKPRAPNCWPIIENFQGVLKFARDEKRRSTKSASDSRVATARAREIELRTAKRAGELCETEEAFAVVDEIFGGLRSDLSGLPARVTRDLEIRRAVENGVNDVLNKAADRLQARAKALRAGSEVASRPQA